MFTFLLVVHAIIAAALVGVILMQRSEGGGLGVGGSPSGLMSARGAADFLTRATTVLATLFVLMCIFLAALASMRGSGEALDTSLVREPSAVQPAQPLPAPTNDPLAGAVAPAPAPAPTAAPAATPKADAAPKKEAADKPAAPAAKPVAAPPVVSLTTPAGNATNTN